MKNIEQQQDSPLEFARKQLNIELQFFWTRATYFSVIVGAIIAAASSNVKPFLEKPNPSMKELLPLLILLFAGFIVSVFWYLAGRGSKFWYEKWEDKVDELEKITKTIDPYWPLYKHHSTKRINDKPCKITHACGCVSESEQPLNKCHILEGFPFSVTKIAILMSLFSMIFFGLAFAIVLYKPCDLLHFITSIFIFFFFFGWFACLVQTKKY